MWDEQKIVEKMWSQNPRNLVASPLSAENLNAVKCVYKYLSPTSWCMMKSSIGEDGYIAPEDPFNLVDTPTMSELKSALDTLRALEKVKALNYVANSSYIIDDCDASSNKADDLKNYPHFGCVYADADTARLSIKLMSLSQIVDFDANCGWPLLNKPNWAFVMPGGWSFCISIQQIKEVCEYMTPSLASLLNTRPLSYKNLGDIVLLHKYLSPLEPNRLPFRFDIIYDLYIPDFTHSTLSVKQRAALDQAIYSIRHIKNSKKIQFQLSDEFKARLPSYVVKDNESDVYTPCDLKFMDDFIRQPNLTPNLGHPAIHMKFGFMMPDGRFTRIFAHQIPTLFNATYGMHSDAELDAIEIVDRYRLSGVGGKFDVENFSVELLRKSEHQWKSLMMVVNLTILNVLAKNGDTRPLWEADTFAIKNDDLPLMPSYGVLLADDSSFVRYGLKTIVDRATRVEDMKGPIRAFDRSGLMLANGRFVPIAPSQILALYNRKLAWPVEPLPSTESRKRAASVIEAAVGRDAKKRYVGESITMDGPICPDIPSPITKEAWDELKKYGETDTRLIPASDRKDVDATAPFCVDFSLGRSVDTTNIQPATQAFRFDQPAPQPAPQSAPQSASQTFGLGSGQFSFQPAPQPTFQLAPRPASQTFGFGCGSGQPALQPAFQPIFHPGSRPAPSQILAWHNKKLW